MCASNKQKPTPEITSHNQQQHWSWGKLATKDYQQLFSMYAFGVIILITTFAWRLSAPEPPAEPRAPAGSGYGPLLNEWPKGAAETALMGTATSNAWLHTEWMVYLYLWIHHRPLRVGQLGWKGWMDAPHRATAENTIQLIASECKWRSFWPETWVSGTVSNCANVDWIVQTHPIQWTGW